MFGSGCRIIRTRAAASPPSQILRGQVADWHAWFGAAPFLLRRRDGDENTDLRWNPNAGARIQAFASAEASREAVSHRATTAGLLRISRFPVQFRAQREI